MNNIIIPFQSFNANQNILVYQNGNIVNSLQASYNEIPELVKNLVFQYEIDEINLVGGENYLQDMHTQLENILYQAGTYLYETNKKVLNVKVSIVSSK